ncbi:DNA translocase FtsK, partial [Candidatus Saccharibacteria bacterium]|nr:DNA translocase FtsK [Candidatus Saccharibacteria bacterium]
DSSSEPEESHKDEKGGKMPYIVILIDEMSDLMMQAGKELEPLIVRIAQLGRAAGMHLVLATQKPVVKVITGLIKGNIPSRIAFRVLTSMESRIILDLSGAEKLLGQGDMLLSTEQTPNGPERIQGAWTPDEDIEKVTDFLRSQRPADYNDEVVAQQVSIKGMGGGGDLGDLGRRYDPSDPLVRKAVEISLNKGKFSTAMLQTYLGKGHGFVSGLAIWFEEIGVIGPQNGNKPRELLISSMEEFDQLTNL